MDIFHVITMTTCLLQLDLVDGSFWGKIAPTLGGRPYTAPLEGGTSSTSSLRMADSSEARNHPNQARSSAH